MRMGWGGVGWGGVGWGGDNTKRVSCYPTWSSLALDATLHDLYLHLRLRYMIFTCTWCYATWSSFTFWQTRMGLGRGGVGIIPNVSRATLPDLYLHLMLRYMVFICTWCYAAWSSLALDATLHDLHLHLMLRYMIFTYSWTNEDRVGLGWDGVGIMPNLSRATLHDFHFPLMLRYMIFTCIWCYATWSLFTFWQMRMGLGWGEVGWGGVGIIPSVSRATLHDLHGHLILRYMIFTCIWC